MSELRTISSADQINYDKLSDPVSGEGIVPVVCLDEQILASAGLRGYLMQGFANYDAVVRTFEIGNATFWSREKQKLWTQGEESGNFLQVRGAYTDCDSDSLLLSVEPLGPACHNGTASCFEIADGVLDPNTNLPPKASLNTVGLLGSITTLDGRGISFNEGLLAETYSGKLIADENELVKKLSSEQGELIREICRPDFDENRFIGECSDVVYSVMLGCARMGVPIVEIFNELARRNKLKN